MEAQPRMLHDLCDGCPSIREELYALDYPSGLRQWYCRACWPKFDYELRRSGVPVQEHTEEKP
jgi:hypothetical protein